MCIRDRQYREVRCRRKALTRSRSGGHNRGSLPSLKPDNHQRNPTLISLIRQAKHLVRRWKVVFFAACITAGMAFAVTWAGGSAKAPAPRDTPPITLTDLDGDGDLDMLVETQTPFGRADDVFNNDGERMPRLVACSCASVPSDR